MRIHEAEEMATDEGPTSHDDSNKTYNKMMITATVTTHETGAEQSKPGDKPVVIQRKKNNSSQILMSCHGQEW